MKLSSISKKSSAFAKATADKSVFGVPPSPRLRRTSQSSVSPRRRQAAAGFTLIELMIVVIIMAALAGMVLPRLLDRADDAKIGIAKADIANITSALKFYKLNVGQYPKSEEGLASLTVRPGSAGNSWKGPYLEREAKDPWGRLYQYQLDPGSLMGFKLWSNGPDEASTEDNINNWDNR